MPKIKTTISIDRDLWKRFSIAVIKERGYRKKNIVIEELIRKWIKEKVEKIKEKVKINAYISKEIWEKFLKKVFEVHGKTSGGAISATMEDAIKLYMARGQGNDG